MIRGPHCGESPGAQKSPAIEVALGNGSCAVASVTRGPVSHQESRADHASAFSNATSHTFLSLGTHLGVASEKALASLEFNR